MSSYSSQDFRDQSRILSLPCGTHTLILIKFSFSLISFIYLPTFLFFSWPWCCCFFILSNLIDIIIRKISDILHTKISSRYLFLATVLFLRLVLHCTAATHLIPADLYFCSLLSAPFCFKPFIQSTCLVLPTHFFSRWIRPPKLKRPLFIHSFFLSFCPMKDVSW